MEKENNNDEPIGEEGISLDENDQASRYNCYQIYNDLLGFKWSEEKILDNMGISKEYLKALKKEFGG